MKQQGGEVGSEFDRHLEQTFGGKHPKPRPPSLWTRVKAKLWHCWQVIDAWAK